MIGRVKPVPAPPPARIPGVVAVREYLATAPHAAVLLLQARAYSQGCLLDFVAVARAGGAEPLEPSPGPTFSVGLEDATLPAEERVLVTGRLTWRGAARDDTDTIVRRLDEPPISTPRLERHTPRLWISPLPPVDGFTLTIAWPEHGIDATTVELPGDTIRQAAWDSYPILPT